MLGVLNSQTTGKLILRDQDVKKSHMYHHLVKSGKNYSGTEFWRLLRGSSMTKNDQKFKADETWTDAHERFVRNQEHRIKKFQMSVTAEKFVRFTDKKPANESESDEEVIKRDINPFEDDDLVKTVALAERRNIHLNETQAKRVDIARRRQRQFVANGRCQDNEMLMKECILKNVPGYMDISPIMLRELKETRKTVERTKSDNFIKREQQKLKKNMSFQRSATVQRDNTPKNLLRESENRPESGQFRARYPDKETILTDVMPPNYKIQISKQKQVLVDGPMFGKNNTKKPKKAKTMTNFDRNTSTISDRKTKISSNGELNPLNGKRFVKSVHNYKVRSKTSNNIPRLPDAIKILQTQ